ncbi:MAG TPA: arginase family protein, partial [Candidatus Lokiarchaeia archaeon]|nr:arginase family protein [Candidatus Lokiarchaeia archaeon]
METRKRVEIIGIPMDLGQNLRGVDMGPSAVRYAELKARAERLGFEVEDKGNISVPVRDYLLNQGYTSFLPAIVETLETVYTWSEKSISEGAFPIFLGGDHSICMGTVGGATAGQTCGLIYVDSHGDFNTFETSPSGNIHGMPLAALLGLGSPDLVNIGRLGPKLSPDEVVIIGTRDLDPEEKVALKK